MTAYRLAYYCLNGREVNAQLAKNFAVETVSNLNVDADNFELMLIQAKSNQLKDLFSQYPTLHWDAKPVVLMANDLDLQDKLKAFDLGIADCIDADASDEELLARCNRLVFDYIANKQLKTQIDYATQTAMQAMSTTSDLGNNIQFFIDSQQCNSLDELGMRLLQSTQAYGLRVSVQLRGKECVKNMEQNGLAKSMESQLLSELAHSGRYFDFGKRTVMNYENVSVLVKNMPVEDSERYGALKDNVFSLLQAANSRLNTIDMMFDLANERKLIEKLVSRTTQVLKVMEQDFLETSKRSASVVQSIADNIEERIQFLGLNEEQENYFIGLMGQAEDRLEQIFASGLQRSENFRREIAVLDALFNDENGVDIRLLAKFLSNS